MKYSRRIFVSICWVLLGAVLVGCSLAGLIEEFWNGMGTAFLVVGGLQIVKHIRYRTNETYREKVDTENQEHRVHTDGKGGADAAGLQRRFPDGPVVLALLHGPQEKILKDHINVFLDEK